MLFTVSCFSLCMPLGLNKGNSYLVIFVWSTKTCVRIFKLLSPEAKTKKFIKCKLVYTENMQLSLEISPMM